MCPDEPRSSLTQRTRSYAKRLQRDRHANTQLAASRILDFALEVLPTIRSAVDLGCGVGTWLVELARRGIHDLVGLEGPWLDPKLLVMPQEWLVACDLTKDIDLGRRFDLALSLEVAEHLPRERGPGFVGVAYGPGRLRALFCRDSRTRGAGPPRGALAGGVDGPFRWPRLRGP